MMLLAIVGISGIVVYLFRHAIEENTNRRKVELSEKERKMCAMASEYKGSYLDCPRGNHGSVKIFTQEWTVDNARGIVLICHGLNSYGGRAAVAIGPYLLKQRYSVCSIDYEGFGRSDGRHGYFNNFDDVVGDIIKYVEKLGNGANKKIFLFGSSLGGLASLRVGVSACKHLLAGAIIQCPALEIGKDARPSKVIETVAHSIKHVIPMLPVSKAERDLSSSECVALRNQEEKELDPLFYSGRLRIGTGLAIAKALENTKPWMENFSVPLLLQHGDADRVCTLAGSKKFIQLASSTDKDLIVYKNGAHDLIHEPDHIIAKIANDICVWLDQRS